MNIIIDNRMREEEKEYLKTFGNIIEIPKQEIVYEEISSHPDIFITKIGEKIICAPCIHEFLLSQGIEVIKGDKDPENAYPKDILYNVFQIGNYVFGNFNYCDKKILDEIDNQNLIKINVKQGYTNCSCTALNDKSFITSDKGIYDAAINVGLNSLYIPKKGIKLSESNMEGFIGGASCVINNQFIIFGDIEKIENKELLIDFLDKNKITLKSFKDFDINDYGGIIFT